MLDGKDALATESVNRPFLVGFMCDVLVPVRTRINYVRVPSLLPVDNSQGCKRYKIKPFLQQQQ